jgi:hypothetical protein
MVAHTPVYFAVVIYNAGSLDPSYIPLIKQRDIVEDTCRVEWAPTFPSLNLRHKIYKSFPNLYTRRGINGTNRFIQDFMAKQTSKPIQRQDMGPRATHIQL